MWSTVCDLVTLKSTEGQKNDNEKSVEPLKDDVVILRREDIHFVSKKAEELYYGSLACESCSNNPKNGGTGICHCILGNPIIY